MLIENMMYFALGALVAGLVALVILPAVWKRAVRLTKRRIESATPITMAEFRADKDQLRAEFALSTRKLEMNIETLRKKLTEQMADANQKRSELAVLKTEHDKNLAVISDFEKREADLRARVSELEQDGADLLERLRLREQEVEARTQELVELRDVMSKGLPPDEDSQIDAEEDLNSAQARIASAENRLNALLAETGQIVEISTGRPGQSLADKLNLEEEVESLRNKVAGIESTILGDWGSDCLEEEQLRGRLGDIAASVSRLVYAAETDKPVARREGESLFDRVQRYADERDSFSDIPVKPVSGERLGGVSNRMAALREIQGQ